MDTMLLADHDVGHVKDIGKIISKETLINANLIHCYENITTNCTKNIH